MWSSLFVSSSTMADIPTVPSVRLQAQLLCGFISVLRPPFLHPRALSDKHLFLPRRASPRQIHTGFGWLFTAPPPPLTVPLFSGNALLPEHTFISLRHIPADVLQGAQKCVHMTCDDFIQERTSFLFFFKQSCYVLEFNFDFFFFAFV
jgi:hypothetical protein